MFPWTFISVILGPLKMIAEALGFFVSISAENTQEVAKVLRARLKSYFLSSINVDPFQKFGIFEKGP